MNYHVYCIYSPYTRNPVYVGTSNNVESRMAQHINSSHSLAIGKFMQNLKDNGKKPVCKILKTFDNPYFANDFEKATIIEFISLGYDLLNHRHNHTKKKPIEYLTDFED